MKTFVIVLLCVGWASANRYLRAVPQRQARQSAGGCAYKGNTYQQGEAWQDGCIYNCICQDAASGHYKCTDRCPSYGTLPPVCTLVKDPGSCCSSPKCNFQAGSGTSTGTGTGTGTSGTGTMTHIAPGQTCVNKINNCASFQASVCSNHDYAQWVQENCCAFCYSVSSGAMVGGTMTGTGTGGTMTGTGGTMTGTGTGGTMTGTGGTMTGTGTGGTMTGGTTICQDAIANCKDYTTAVCTDANYAQWVGKNCPVFCNKCTAGSVIYNTGGTGTGTGGTMTGTGTGGTGTGTGGTMTGTGTGGTGTGTGVPIIGTGTGGTMIGTGTGTGGGTGGTTICRDALPNCKDYTTAVCTDANYAQWVGKNCPVFCNKCTAGSVIYNTGGTGTGTGGTMIGTGTGGTGTGTGVPIIGTGTGGTMIGTGTGTGGGTGGTTICRDALPNCKDYTTAVCTDANYAQWVGKNCPVFCNKCTAGSVIYNTGGTGTGTGGTMTGTGTGGTGTGTGVPMPGTGGTMTGTGTGVPMPGPGTGGTMTGTGTGGTMTGTGTGTVTGTGGTTICQDAIANCKDYTTAVCTDANYAQWVGKNCPVFCNKCTAGSVIYNTGGTGTGTGGTMTGTGTGGTGTGTGVPMPGTGTGGTMTGTGTGGTVIGTGGTGTGTGTMACADVAGNCDAFGPNVCSDNHFAQWVMQNCQKYCNKCYHAIPITTGTGGTMTGTGGTGTGTGGTMTGTGGTMTGTGGTGTGTGGTMTGTGGTMTGTGACADAISNCAAYTTAVCTKADYDHWVLKNCPLFCNKCGSGTGGTMTGTGTGGTMTGTGTGGTMTGTGGTMTGTGTGGTMTGTGTGGTMTGTGTGGTMTGTGTGTGTCADLTSNCAVLNQNSHICTEAGSQLFAQQNCALTCNLCSTYTTGTGTGVVTGQYTGAACADAIQNCKTYDLTSICVSKDYESWAIQNCAKTCNLCSHFGSGTGMVSGTGAVTGTGSTSGCAYDGQVYQQGASWRDACKFSCTCVDGSTGKYECKQLCVKWTLPTQCHMNPPGPGKCCDTPSCPAGFNIQYPQGYIAQ